MELRKPVQKPPRGRPARLSVRDIVHAANEIGLSNLTLKDVAARLGVTTAALYRYVQNREQLVSLAAFELALERQMPIDRQAHWSDIARGYAFGMFDLLAAEPQLICEMMNGTLGPDSEVDFIEDFIQQLKPHGLSATDSIRLHHAVAMLAVGAAVGAVSLKSSYSEKRSRAATMRMLLARRGPDELPGVRSALSAYADIAPEQWHRALDTMLAGIAAGRGEKLPERV